MTITRSAALIAPNGVYAGIPVFTGSNGVTIATAGVNVVLRGLTIYGQGGNFGIFMTKRARLTVENCLVANLMYGIVVDTAAIVRVTDTTIRDNVSHGLLLKSGTRATVSRAAFSGHGDMGIIV